MPTGKPGLTVGTQAALATRSVPGVTATNLNPAVLRHTNNTTGTGSSTPGGVKAECSNCRATHTPLWCRGLNNELNCNACGLYCKLVSRLLSFIFNDVVADSHLQQHKHPRPKSMCNTHGEDRTQADPRQEAVDVMGKTVLEPLSLMRINTRCFILRAPSTCNSLARTTQTTSCSSSICLPMSFLSPLLILLISRAL